MTVLALEVMEDFHLRLVELMGDRGFSYRDLSTELKLRGMDVSHDKVGAWCRDERCPSLGEALELARIFGVSLEYLATGEEAARHQAMSEQERDLIKAAHVVGMSKALRRVMAADEPTPAAGGEFRPAGVLELPGRRRRSGQPKRDHERSDRKKDPMQG